MTGKKRKSFAAGVSAGLAAESAEAAGGPDNYEVFARVYDRYMEHVPYGEWAGYLRRSHRRLTGSDASAVLDLACGTGRLLEHFPAKMRREGLDRSGAMLDRAREILPDVRFYRSRLERMPLRNRSRPFLVCTHDSLNYLTNPEDLQRHFREVERILTPGGLYSADIVSLSNILGNFDGKTTVSRLGQYRLVWSNSYDRRAKEMLSVLEFRPADRRAGEQIVRAERHIQRYYEIAEVKAFAQEAGLETIAVEGDYEVRNARQKDNLWNLHFRKPA